MINVRFIFHLIRIYCRFFKILEISRTLENSRWRIHETREKK
jgi:hypothetical protein